MGTFGIDFDMGPLKGGSRDDLESCRLSFDTIEMTGESLMRRLFEFCFLHFSRWRPPFEPGGHPGEPWPEAAYWSLSWDHISWESGQTAAKILIAFKAGRHRYFFWIFSLCFLQRVNSISKKPQYPPPPCNRGAFNRTHLLRIFCSSWLPTLFTCQYKEYLLAYRTCSEHLFCYFWYLILIFLYFFW